MNQFIQSQISFNTQSIHAFNDFKAQTSQNIEDIKSHLEKLTPSLSTNEKENSHMNLNLHRVKTREKLEFCYKGKNGNCLLWWGLKTQNFQELR